MKNVVLLLILTLLVFFGHTQTTYTFTGNGYWTDSTNWSNNKIPPDTLTASSIINVSPPAGDTCILNKTQVVSNGGNLIVTTGASFVIQGGLIINEPTFPSVLICNQTWMTKNLDVSTYRNGDTIPQVTDPTAWANFTTGAWCYYNNDPANNATYGKLYNWYAVNDSRGLAPVGWHIPSDAEWKKLTDTCLGGSSVAGGKMKTTGIIDGGTGLWYSPNTSATNSSEFTGLPGGYFIQISSIETYFGIHYFGGWWSSTKYSNYAWARILGYNTSIVDRGNFDKSSGFSVRCVKN